MTRGGLITIGTTAQSLANLFRGINAVAGASSSQVYNELLSDQLRELQMQCDAGTIYMKEDPAVSATNYSTKLLTGATKHLNDAKANSLNLSNFWIVAAAADAKLAVEFTSF